MARLKKPPRSSLRNNIMIAFFLAIILLGVSITATSHHILRRALLDSDLPAESIQRIGQQVTQMLTGFTLAGMVLAIGIAALLSRTITEPLRRLLAGVAEIGNGNLGAHIDMAGDDELGRLATAFNAMAQKLKQSHDHLETTVEKRTVELSQANHHLQTEVVERRRTAEQLRRSEKRFTIMADSAQDAIMMMDPKGHITFYNKTAETIFQWAASEAIGKDLHALITPQRYREAYRKGLAHFRHTGEGSAIGKTLELTALRKDGTEFPIEISLAGTELDHEWHAIGIVRDIAERKQFEAELKESLSLLEATLDATADGILVVDGKGKIKNFNRKFVDLWGIPESVLETKDDDKALSVALTRLEDPDAFYAQVRGLYGSPEQEGSGLISFRDGRIVEYHSKSQFLGEQIVGRIWSFRDITERQRAEEKLQATAEEWVTTFDSIADPVSIQNSNYEILRVNKAFAQVAGKEPEELVGRKCYEIVHGTKEPWPTCPHSCTLREGQPRTETFFEPNLDCHVEVATWPVFGKRGQIEGSVHIIKNINDRKDAEAKQALLIRKLEEVNEELSHFAYVVSHDLKAPLRGIKLLTEWLCTDYSDQLGDEAKENLDLLQSRVDRMHNLIEGVLQYSRVGRIKEDKTNVDLNELLPEIIDAIAPPEHVTISVEAPLPNLECEPTRITQVFQNLLSNAVKYMDKPVGQISVACEDAGDAWKFRVADNGPGIEERYFDRIFKIFQTLTSRDEFESTGVGLTLVKKIVELYGGRIGVESEVGHGSTFFFTLPKQKVAMQDEPLRADITSHGEHLQETVTNQ